MRTTSPSRRIPARRDRHVGLRVAGLTGALLAATLIIGGPSPATAQTEVEISCTPEAVPAGDTTACAVAGAQTSTRVTLTLLRGQTVVAEASGLLDTRGSGIIDVAIPRTSPVGALTVTLAGSDTGFPLTVLPALPSSVAAGDAPSTHALATRVPPAGILSLAVILVALLWRRPGALAAGRRLG